MTKPLWLPWAIRKPIPKTQSDPYITPIGDVFHVAVSKSDSLFDYFAHRSGGIESTGYIRFDGTTEQYRPFNVQCDAQAQGNDYYDSWETEGMGDGEWTPEQLATIKRIILFKHEHWGHPLVQTPRWNAPGFGYHSLFPEWNPNSHTCPGAARIRQWNQIIVPWMREGGSEDVDLTKENLDQIATAVQRAVWARPLDPEGHSAGLMMAWAANSAQRTEKALREGVAALRTAVDANASPAEVRGLLDNLDATINLVVKDGDTA